MFTGVENRGPLGASIVSAQSLLGNPLSYKTLGQSVGLGSTLTFVGNLLETTALTGDIYTSANSFATTISNNVVSNAKFRQSNGLSIVGNSTNSLSNVADITATTANQTLVVDPTGTFLQWGALNVASSNAVTGVLNVVNGGTGSSTAAGARANLGLDNIRFVGDAIVTIVATNKYVVTNAAFTASRAWTLPAASACNPGQGFIIEDMAGALTLTNTLVVTAAGSDTINGVSTITVNDPYATVCLVTDGVNKWAAQVTKSGAARVASSSSTTYNVTTTGGVVIGNIAKYSDVNGTVIDSGIPAANLVSSVTTAGGDLTGTYPNPTIATNAVTYAKFQQVAASSIVGNPTGSTANAQAISLGAALTFSGTALQTTAMSGDVSTPANSFVTTIGANKVTYAKFQQTSAAGVLIGNGQASAGNVGEIGLGATLAFGSGGTLLTTVAMSGDVSTSANSFATTIGANKVTYAKIQQVSSGVLLGNGTASTANASEISLGATLGFSSGGSVLGTVAMSGDVTTPANSFATTVVKIGGVPVGTLATMNANNVNLTGGTITGVTVTGLPTPTGGTDAVTKNYVDGLAAGLSQKATCRVGTTAALTVTYSNGTAGVGATLTNAGTQAALVIDTVTLSVGDRVLVCKQATQTQNGIYTVTNIGSGSTNWVLTRATDFDNNATTGTIKEGNYTVIEEGSPYSSGGNIGTLWILTGTGTASYTLGTSSLVFVELSVAPQSTTYTGDVTGSGSVSVALTISANSVTYAKLQQVGAYSLVGNATGSTANATNITLGSTFSWSGAAIQTVAMTGDVTTSTNSFATTISANSVTYAKFQQVAASSIVGNPTGSTANSQAISLGATLTFNSTALQTTAMTGDVTTSPNSFATTISNNAVTYAKFQQVAASSLIGNPTGSLANSQGITLGSTLTFTGTALQTTAMTGDVTTSANSFATTLTANVVSNAKFRQSAGLSVVGNAGTTTANVADIVGTAGQILQVNTAGTALAFSSLNLSDTAITGTLLPQYGGTGVSNASSSTITLGGALAFSGAYTTTFTVTGPTTLTLPTSGTVTALGNTTTGTGSTIVLATGPTLTNPVVGTQAAYDNSTKAASTAYVQAQIAQQMGPYNLSYYAAM